MKLLDRYIAGDFLQILSFAFVAFVLVFVLVDLIENLDKFVDNHTPVKTVVLYYIYYVPYILALTAPIAVLLAGGFLASIKNRNYEIVAIRSCGIGTARVSLPILIIGFLVVVFVFLLSEFVVPKTNLLKNQIRREKILKRRYRRSPKLLVNYLYQSKGGKVYYFHIYRPNQERGERVVIQFFDKGEVIRRIDAEKVFRRNGVWFLVNGVDRVFQGEEEVAFPFDTLVAPMDESPDEFRYVEVSPEEMGICDLALYIKRLRSSGVPATRERVDLLVKVAYPMTNLIILFLVLPLSFHFRRGGFLFGVGEGVFFSFIYYLLLRFGQALGYSGDLPPVVAAFLGDIVFLACGVYVFFRYNE
ncbi:LptF/LptG family permease [bacterium]|nr:LptF/LptG family permease [bacterium]